MSRERLIEILKEDDEKTIFKETKNGEVQGKTLADHICEARDPLTIILQLERRTMEKYCQEFGIQNYSLHKKQGLRRLILWHQYRRSNVSKLQGVFTQRDLEKPPRGTSRERLIEILKDDEKTIF